MTWMRVGLVLAVVGCDDPAPTTVIDGVKEMAAVRCRALESHALIEGPAARGVCREEFEARACDMPGVDCSAKVAKRRAENVRDAWDDCLDEMGAMQMDELIEGDIPESCSRALLREEDEA